MCVENVNCRIKFPLFNKQQEQLSLCVVSLTKTRGDHTLISLSNFHAASSENECSEQSSQFSASIKVGARTSISLPKQHQRKPLPASLHTVLGMKSLKFEVSVIFSSRQGRPHLIQLMRTLCPRAHFFFIFCWSQLQGEKGKMKGKTAHQYHSLKQKKLISDQYQKEPYSHSWGHKHEGKPPTTESQFCGWIVLKGKKFYPHTQNSSVVRSV